jgi:hypothetical protein
LFGRYSIGIFRWNTLIQVLNCKNRLAYSNDYRAGAFFLATGKENKEYIYGQINQIFSLYFQHKYLSMKKADSFLADNSYKIRILYQKKDT